MLLFFFFQLKAIVRFAWSIAKSINLYSLILKLRFVGYSKWDNIVLESKRNGHIQDTPDLYWSPPSRNPSFCHTPKIRCIKSSLKLITLKAIVWYTAAVLIRFDRGYISLHRRSCIKVALSPCWLVEPEHPHRPCSCPLLKCPLSSLPSMPQVWVSRTCLNPTRAGYIQRKSNHYYSSSKDGGRWIASDWFCIEEEKLYSSKYLKKKKKSLLGMLRIKPPPYKGQLFYLSLSLSTAETWHSSCLV